MCGSIGADYSVVQKPKRKKKTRKRSHNDQPMMSPPHTPPPLPPPLRAKMVEECMVNEKEVCPVDNNIVEFKLSREEACTRVDTEIGSEMDADQNTASGRSETAKEEEPSDLGLTCVRCRKPLAPSRAGKHYRHAL